MGPVVIWGAGAMGGSIGAWLHRAGVEVLFVDADRAHVAAIRERGLRITGPVDEFTVRAQAVTPEELAAGVPAGVVQTGVAVEEEPRGTPGRPGPAWPPPPFHVVLLAVKAHHTRTAVEALAPHLAEDGCVVSVQNGLNERVIAEVVGESRTMGCFVNFGADVMEPGVVMRGNRGAVVVGELDGAVTPRVQGIHELLRVFEPDAVLTDNIHGFLWGKLAYGALLFATALTDASIADVLASTRHRPVLVEMGREVVRATLARGIRPEPFNGFDPRAFHPDASDQVAHASLDELVAFNRGSAKSHSGVWRDLAVRKRKTEVDAQIAPIAELAAATGVDTPLVRRLVELVHDVEEGRRAQGWETLDALGE